MRNSRIKQMLLRQYYAVLNVWQDIYKSRYALSSHFKRKLIKIMDTPTTISLVLSENKSVARFGDGELSAIYNSQGIAFQRWSPELGNRLRRCLIDKHDNVILCMPRYIIDDDNCNKMAKKFWRKYLRQNLHFILDLIQSTCGFNYVFGDAHMTRPYIDIEDKSFSKIVFPMLKKIWDGRRVLIVEGDRTCLGVGNDLLANASSIKRILCPNENAFEFYDDILKCVKENVQDGDLVLAALGPTATVLAVDLSDCGIQCVDIGHIDIEYEWYIKGASSPSPIEGKYTNLDGGRNPSLHTEEEYQNSVIARIV